MKKLIQKFTSAMIVALSYVAQTKSVPLLTKGYEMYLNAVNKTSISDKANQLKNRENYVTYNEISESYRKTVIGSEDRRFYIHSGIDYIGIVRATVHNLKAGAFVQGGSTITQQLAKNLYFSFEKKVERKVAEAFLAFDLEKHISKQEILELYCNVAYYGENCNGIREAALHYYGIEPAHLNEEQSYALSKTLKNPLYFNPNAVRKLAV